MSDVNSDIYPQMVSGVQLSSIHNGTTLGTLFFKRGNGIVFMRPEEVTSADIGGNTIKLTCKTRGYLNRIVQTHETRMNQFQKLDDEIGCMYMEIQMWSNSIFRVKFSKDEARLTLTPPPLNTQMLVDKPDEKLRAQIEETEDEIIVSTDQITLHIKKNPLRMEAYDNEGKLFWRQERTDYFTADVFDISIAERDGKVGCFESFMVGQQEEIFGLGERFDHVNRKGVQVDFWNKDAIGVSNTRTYINIPFLFSTAGYGLFLNSSAKTEWEVSTLEASTLGFSVEDDNMDYFVIYGPKPADILYKYCTLTGFAPTPPVWSFGLWMSRCSYTSWDMVEEIAKELKERKIPTDVIHIDTAWFKDDWNCDLKFSKERFPDPEKHMRRLREDGFRVSLWQYNFIPTRDDNENYKEALEKGYLVSGKDGKPYTYPKETVGSWIDDAIIDFSNPDACKWYADKIKDLIKMGVSTIKTDFGEGIPEDGIFKNIDGHKFHNLYSLVYNSVISDAIYEVTGERIVWARSGTSGSQRYPVHWGGDSYCDFSNLAGTLRGMLSIGLSGIPFFSHDIGGFIGKPTPELYVRWAQLGLFSSHSRCHGTGNLSEKVCREPWAFGREAEEIFRQYDILRYRLIPYIYSQAIVSSKTGKPMARALILEYPDDRNLWYIDDQYMFGDSILIAPVLKPLKESNIRSLYLPKGIWIDYWTKDVIESSGMWVDRKVDLKTMPMYVKAGSIIPYGEERYSTNDEIGKIDLIEVYDGADGVLNYDDGKTRFNAKLVSSQIEIDGLDYKPKVVVYGKSEVK